MALEFKLVPNRMENTFNMKTIVSFTMPLLVTVKSLIMAKESALLDEVHLKKTSELSF